MARTDDEEISTQSDRLRSILAGLEFARGDRQADLLEQARQAIADLASARRRTAGQPAVDGSDESKAE